jgi:hypothetical protein
LAKWILRFDPLNQNSANQGDGMDFLQEDEGRALQEFTDQILIEAVSLQNPANIKVPPNFSRYKGTRSRTKPSHFTLTASHFNHIVRLGF